MGTCRRQAAVHFLHDLCSSSCGKPKTFHFFQIPAAIAISNADGLSLLKVAIAMTITCRLALLAVILRVILLSEMQVFLLVVQDERTAEATLLLTASVSTLQDPERCISRKAHKAPRRSEPLSGSGSHRSLMPLGNSIEFQLHTSDALVRI